MARKNRYRFVVKFSYSAGIVVVALASFIMIVFCMFNLNVYWIE